LNQLLLHFSYLQVLDFLTTVTFLLYGIREGNPFVRLVMEHAPSPLAGLVAVKLLAMALGVLCWWMGKERLLWRANVLFAVLVAWNLVAIIVGSAGAT